MDFFFNPRSIAVIGASPNPLRGGNAIIKNLIRGFPGPIYPINPKHKEIEGLTCFPRISEIRKPVDLAIIFIPASLVPETLRDCAAAGVKGVMIESGGFAEIGDEGRILQEECRAIGKEARMRLWGPNCMGLVDARRNYVFSFLAPNLWAEGFPPGTVSIIVQSGMLSGSFIADLVSHGTMGISKVCSIGNKADVDECELLEFLIKDPETAVVALYLEGIPKGRLFLEIVSQSSKPVVVLKGGKSPQGAKAAMSHTASLAGDDRVVQDAFAQAGVIHATDFHQMFDIARALGLVPKGLKAQSRLAVVTFSGSAGIVAADCLHKCAIGLADLSAESCQRLKEFFPSWMPVSNPIDLWPAAEVMGAVAYHRAVEIVLNDPGVDVLFIETFVGGFRLDLDLDHIARLSREKGKPIFFWIVGTQKSATEFQKQAQGLGMPVYREISRAVEAIHAVYAHGMRRERVIEKFPAFVPATMEETIREALRDVDPGAGTLDEFDSKKILKAAGIPTVKEEIATDALQAMEIANAFGFPVVLKGLVPGKIHKTELGLVKLNLRDKDQLLSAFEDLRDKIKAQGRILIQKYVRADFEFICGMIRDPQFGPAIMFGLGGVMAELFQDVVFRVAPFNHRTAEQMLNSIRANKVLEGFRGSQAINREALARVLVALGWIGTVVPRMTQIDINPLAVVDGKVLALDATLILENNHEVYPETQRCSERKS